jgi:hypothetical protein
VTDQAGATVCDREIDIVASPVTTVNYYTGQNHAWVESYLAVTEVAAAGMLDCSPLSVGAYSIYVFGNGYRTTAGSNDNNFVTTGQLFMIDNGASAVVNRMRLTGRDQAGNVAGGLDIAGNLNFIPCEVSTNYGGTNKWNGRPYQVFLVDSTVGSGMLKTITIGNAGETGTFRTLGVTIGPSNAQRWAVRQA